MGGWYSQANGAPFVAIGDKLLPLSPDRDGLSTLHLWKDGSVIETFIDKKHVVTTRCYAAAAGPAELRVVWNGASNLLKNLSVSAIGLYAQSDMDSMQDAQGKFLEQLMGDRILLLTERVQ